MPYTKSEFDSAKQDKFKASVASAAGTIASNVDILSITEERRRAGGIDIETKICAADEAGMDKMSESLGSGDAVKTKINTELKKQGLREATASTSLSSSSSQNSKNGVKNSEGWFIITGCVGLVVLLCLCACCFRFQKCARSEEKLASRAVELSSAPEPMDPDEKAQMLLTHIKVDEMVRKARNRSKYWTLRRLINTPWMLDAQAQSLTEYVTVEDL